MISSLLKVPLPLLLGQCLCLAAGFSDGDPELLHSVILVQPGHTSQYFKTALTYFE